jgi:acyltransferase
MSARDATLDNARAIGIVAVVLGHTVGLPSSAESLIYAVHMPLFFVLSGWLLKSDRETPLRSVAQRQTRSLLLPYGLFFMLGYGYWLLTRNLGARAEKFAGVAWYEPLLGVVTARQADLQASNGPIWFFVCLFVATLMWVTLQRLLPRGGGVQLAVGAALAAGIALPWLASGPGVAVWWLNLNIAVVAMAFMAVGSALASSTTVRGTLAHLSRKRAAAAASVLLCLYAACALQRGRVDMAAWVFGGHALGFWLTACLGVAGVLILARALPRSRAALWLSHHSLVIFPTHVIVLNLNSGLAQKLFGFGQDDVRTLGFALVSTGIAIMAAWPVAVVLRRAMPSIFKPMPRAPLETPTQTSIEQAPRPPRAPTARA